MICSIPGVKTEHLQGENRGFLTASTRKNFQPGFKRRPRILANPTTNIKLDLGSIHLSAEITFQADSFGKVPKLRLGILAWKKCAKTFGMEFRLEIFGGIFWHQIPCRKFWHGILARRCIEVNSQTKILSPLFTVQILILPTVDPFQAQKS